jgi:hypothetical protein
MVSDWTTSYLASHAYSSPGEYTVHLKVRDNHGKEDNTTIKVSIIRKDVPVSDSGNFTIPDWVLPVVILILIVVNVAVIGGRRWYRNKVLRQLERERALSRTRARSRKGIKVKQAKRVIKR